MPRTALVATASLLVAAAVPAAQVSAADAAPAARVSATARPVTVAEGRPAAVVRVRLSSAATKTVTIRWRTKDGTARAGRDYRRSSGTLRIPKGHRSGTLRVRLLDDRRDERAETFRVALSSGSVRVPSRPATVRIVDNDPSALVGTVTVKQPVTVESTSGTQTVTLKVHLVPTGTAGQWRDDGTGTWTASGQLTGTSELCPDPSTTISGSGRFLTRPGTPTAERAALLLTGFRDAAAPALTLDGASTATTSSYIPLFIPPNSVSCFPTSGSAPSSFTIPAPGASGSYTGSPRSLRGVRFSSSSGGTTVSGTLTPVN